MISIWLVLLILTVVSLGYTAYQCIFNSFDKFFKVFWLWGILWTGYLLGKFV